MIGDEVLIMKALVAEMEYLEAFSSKAQTCLRKSVGVSILDIVRTREGQVIIDRLTKQHNGPPNVLDSVCSNEVGNCGCSHAEPRAIMDILSRGWVQKPDRGLLIMVSQYTPCTNCANIIMDSRVISGFVWKNDTPHDPRGLDIITAGLPSVLSMTEVISFLHPLRGMEESASKAAKIVQSWF